MITEIKKHKLKIKFMTKVSKYKPNSQLLKQVCGISFFKGDCDKNIHWYIGIYSQGQWIYNECAYCKKRQEN